MTPMTGDRKPQNPAPPEVMTIEDLARYLQLSKSSLYKLAQDGRIPAQKAGRHWRFHKPAIDAWLSEGGSAAKSRRNQARKH